MLYSGSKATTSQRGHYQIDAASTTANVVSSTACAEETTPGAHKAPHAHSGRIGGRMCRGAQGRQSRDRFVRVQCHCAECAFPL